MNENKEFTYKYPRPMVTVDAVIFCQGKVLLIQRANSPYQGKYALPGGFVDMDEDLIDAAARELQEETGLKGVNLEQLATFGKPGRDPRGRSISVVYAGVVDGPVPFVKGGDDAACAVWLEVDRVMELAFDHGQILMVARKWLGERTKKADLRS